MMCTCKLRKVGRIQFLRSVHAIYVEKSILQTKVIICSEFNDPLEPELFADIHLTVRLIQASSIRNSSTEEIHVASELFSGTVLMTDGSCNLSLQLPLGVSGEHCLLISINNEDSCATCGTLTSHVINGVYILPLISEPFTILPLESTTESSNRVLLGSYRLVPLRYPIESVSNSAHLIIREEYGATLGSHLYDSSVVLLRYLQSITPKKTNSVVLELGSGCGLVGLWYAAAHSQSTVYLSDLICQKYLITSNISVNSAQDRCKYVELEWGNDKHTTKFMSSLSGDSSSSASHPVVIDTIIATDVLYDRNAAKSLFNTLRKVATPGVSEILIAQKLRQNVITNVLHVDIGREEGLQDVTKVYEEADVIIWSFKLL